MEQSGNWTFGRVGDGYIALYSWREPEWVEYDPEVLATNGMERPFDLRANGGADNVWIVECGTAQQWGDFRNFRSVIASSAIRIRGEGEERDVEYESPSQGRIHFGWEGPFVVDDRSVSLVHGRMENPFVSLSDDGQVYDIEYAGQSLRLDFTQSARSVGIGTGR